MFGVVSPRAFSPFTVELPRLPLATFKLMMETSEVGHALPSGASLDRRSWVEVLGEDGAVESPPDKPHPCMFHDIGTDGDGKIAHMFREVESVESRVIPALVDTGTCQRTCPRTCRPSSSPNAARASTR